MSGPASERLTAFADVVVGDPEQCRAYLSPREAMSITTECRERKLRLASWVHTKQARSSTLRADQMLRGSEEVNDPHKRPCGGRSDRMPNGKILRSP